MRRKLMIISIVVLVLLAGAMYGYREYTRGVSDLIGVKSDFSMEDRDLLAEFESNEGVANKKYLGKILSVSGNLHKIDSNDEGNLFIILGSEERMSSIRCSMDSTHQEKVGGLRKGSRITIKGACTGFNADELLGSDIILNRCVLETE